MTKKINVKINNYNNFSFLSNNHFTSKNIDKIKFVTNLFVKMKFIRIFLFKVHFFNKIINTILAKTLKNFLFVFCSFTYSKIFLKVGLGFRKKYSKTTKIYSLAVGRRRWVSFNLQPASFFFNVRRRGIYMFCNSKQKLYKNINKLRIMRKETVFKVKGIMTLNRIMFSKKIARSIVFARRVKFRKLKLKLNKKQKQRK